MWSVPRKVKNIVLLNSKILCPISCNIFVFSKTDQILYQAKRIKFVLVCIFMNYVYKMCNWDSYLYCVCCQRPVKESNNNTPNVILYYFYLPFLLVRFQIKFLTNKVLQYKNLILWQVSSGWERDVYTVLLLMGNTLHPPAPFLKC